MVDHDLPDGSSGYAHKKQRDRVVFLLKDGGNKKQETDEGVGGAVGLTC